MRWTLGVLCVLGAVLRLRELIFNRSLWLDESFLALNLLDRDFAGLLSPLDHLQTAPLLFLWASELVTYVFGFQEWALRLPALISGLAALVCIALLARKILCEQVAIVAAVALTVVSPQLIEYSAELKPYSTDLLAGALLTWLALRANERAGDANIDRRLFLFAAVATILVFASTPSVFVIAGIGSVLGVRSIVERRWKDHGKLGVISLVTVCAFGIHFVLVLRHAAAQERFYSRWGEHFADTGNSQGHIGLMLDTVIRFFSEGLWLRPYWPALLLGVTGFVWLAFRRSWVLAILVAPVLVTYAVSLVGKYPLGPRVLMFLAPATLILIGAGVEALTAAARQLARHRLAPSVTGVIVTIVLVAPVAWTSAQRFAKPIGHEELRPLLEQVAAERQPDEAIWFSGRAIKPYTFYATVRPELKFDEDLGPVFLSERRTIEGPEIAQQIDAMFPDRGVWIVFSHFRPDSDDPAQAAERLEKERELLLSRPVTGAHLLRFGPMRNAPTTAPDSPGTTPPS